MTGGSSSDNKGGLQLSKSVFLVACSVEWDTFLGTTTWRLKSNGSCRLSPTFGMTDVESILGAEVVFVLSLSFTLGVPAFFFMTEMLNGCAQEKEKFIFEKEKYVFNGAEQFI